MQQKKENRAVHVPAQPREIEPNTGTPCEVPFDKSIDRGSRDQGVLVSPEPWGNP